MSNRNFRDMLEAQWSRGNFVCVGLDTEYRRIPISARVKDGYGGPNTAGSINVFNDAIVDATKDLTCAYKLNVAFYLAKPDSSIDALSWAIDSLRNHLSDVPIILDAKWGDIPETNKKYARIAFDILEVDAVTVNPYVGCEALQPFLDYKDKGVFVVCQTSNTGSSEFQNLSVSVSRDEMVFLSNAHAVPWSSSVDGTNLTTLSNHIAYTVAKSWNKNNNCGLVAGANYPRELESIRNIVGDMPILIPGIGAQGGDLEKTVKAAKDTRGQGMIISSSRNIIFASNGPDFAEAARRETIKLRDAINQYRLASPEVTV